jgi:hypothetical protein
VIQRIRSPHISAASHACVTSQLSEVHGMACDPRQDLDTVSKSHGMYCIRVIYLADGGDRDPWVADQMRVEVVRAHVQPREAIRHRDKARIYRMLPFSRN